MEGYDIRKNGEGYPDPTAYATLKREQDEESRKQSKPRAGYRHPARRRGKRNAL